MTISHHPDELLLAAYAAGTLNLGQHVAMATHLAQCPRCRGWASALECVGGVLLEDMPPVALAAGALANTLTRLEEVAAPSSVATDLVADAPPELPRFVRRYRFGAWRYVAPRIRVRPIQLPEPSQTRVFLLTAPPGTTLLEHEHTGLEMTCVLSGAFVHEGGHFGPGDFDLGDPTIDHAPRVDPGTDCVCLIAMDGRLKYHGFFGRLIQPFVRL